MLYNHAYYNRHFYFLFFKKIHCILSQPGLFLVRGSLLVIWDVNVVVSVEDIIEVIVVLTVEVSVVVTIVVISLHIVSKDSAYGTALQLCSE